MFQKNTKSASVSFDNVTKVYGHRTTGVRAVENVSMEIKAGTLVTLLGPSGCGKTTTLRMIAGLEMPTEGSIHIGDQDVTALPATDRDVSMVFQSYALFPHMTVRENVSYGLKFSGFGKAEAAERASEGLNLVGLSGYGDRLPSELSGGQQQRVAVARALVLEPQVLLFDEPLSNLDAKLRRQVREEIRDIQQKLQLTVVYVTHDQEEALAVSDRIVVMNEAVIAQDGTPRELYDAPASQFVADFIGESNILKCEVKEVRDGRAIVDLDGYRLELPSRGMTVGPAHLGIRPNRILFVEQGEPDCMPGEVLRVTYVGNHLELTVKTGQSDLFVTTTDVDAQLEPGSNVGLRFAKNGPVLLSG